MATGTYRVKSRIPSKDLAHNILLMKIKHIYKDDYFNVSELSRLSDIPYTRLSRLIFDDAIWTATEWWTIVILCDADGALAQMHRATTKRLANYHKTTRYFKKLPKIEQKRIAKLNAKE